MSYTDASPAEAMTIEFYPTAAPLGARPTLDPYAPETRAAEDQLAGAQGSFVFQPEFMAAHGLGDYLMRSSHYVPREEWSEGRRDSQQVVEFGNLEITIDNGEVVTVPVAAKPYRLLERERAIHEYAALLAFRDHPDLRTFEPLGFWIDETGKPLLLTVFEEPVTTLDNADWGETGDDAILSDYDLREALEKSAQILARLHLSGFAHRDAQIKNMAVDTSTDSVRLIDLPKLTAVDGSPDGDEIRWQQLIADDLATLVASICRRGFMAGHSPAVKRDVIAESLLEPHHAMLRHPAYSDRLSYSARDSLGGISRDILSSL